VIEADPIATAVRAFMSAQTEWKGTFSNLLTALGEEVDDRIARSKTWPESPRALSGRLRRAATFLRKIGIEVAFNREGKARTRIVHITTAPENAGAQPSAPSAQPASGANGTNVIDLAATGLRTVAGNENGSDVATVRANPLGTNPLSGADGADAKSPPQSAAGGTETPGWRGRV
jgi:hypothetical protein